MFRQCNIRQRPLASVNDGLRLQGEKWYISTRSPHFFRPLSSTPCALNKLAPTNVARQSPWLTLLATLAALLAFAANSLLCRWALRPLSGAGIDAASFTALRLISGALMLASLFGVARGKDRTLRFGGHWLSAAALFVYAIAFSFAYTSLTAGLGALLLFGSVQATMLAWGMSRGERLRWPEVTGFAMALSGLVYLMTPGLKESPPIIGSGLMALAGVAWGVYSLRGRGAGNPLAATAGNFARTVPLAIIAAICCAQGLQVDLRGALLATTSGAITSGLGYVIWYQALKGLTATRAAIVQLAVPVLTATVGVLLLSEPLSLRLFIAAILILGGIALAVLHKAKA